MLQNLERIASLTGYTEAFAKKMVFIFGKPGFHKFALGDQSAMSPSHFFTPADEVAEIDIGCQILFSKFCIDFPAAESLMPPVGPE